MKRKQIKKKKEKEKEDILCGADRPDNPVELDLFKNPLINHQVCS